MFYFYPERLPCLNNNEANKEKYILVWPSLLFPFLLSSSPVRNSISALITNSSTSSPFSLFERPLKIQLPFIALSGHSARSGRRLFLPPCLAEQPRGHHAVSGYCLTTGQKLKAMSLHSLDTGNPFTSQAKPEKWFQKKSFVIKF